MDNAPTVGSRDLRSFGLVTGAVVAGLFGLALPLLRGEAVPRWPWVVAVPLVLAALVAPRSLRGVYRAWMRIGHVLGAINTRIILGILFFLVFTPVGVAMRLFGRDPLARRIDPDAPSYRVVTPKDQQSSMEVPF